MSIPTTNQGYIDASNYEGDPAGQSPPDSIHHDHDIGVKARALVGISNLLDDLTNLVYTKINTLDATTTQKLINAVGNLNDFVQATVVNSNTGTSAMARTGAAIAGASTYLEQTSIGHTGSGARQSNTGLVYSSGSNKLNFAVTGSGGIHFYTNGDTASEHRMSITNTGTGIGTATPGSKLSIVGLPTSAAGLSAGDVWSNSGVLTIV